MLRGAKKQKKSAPGRLNNSKARCSSATTLSNSTLIKVVAMGVVGAFVGGLVSTKSFDQNNASNSAKKNNSVLDIDVCGSAIICIPKISVGGVSGTTTDHGDLSQSSGSVSATQDGTTRIEPIIKP